MDGCFECGELLLGTCPVAGGTDTLDVNREVIMVTSVPCLMAELFSNSASDILTLNSFVKSEESLKALNIDSKPFERVFI